MHSAIAIKSTASRLLKAPCQPRLSSTCQRMSMRRRSTNRGEVSATNITSSSDINHRLTPPTEATPIDDQHRQQRRRWSSIRGLHSSIAASSAPASCSSVGSPSSSMSSAKDQPPKSRLTAPSAFRCGQSSESKSSPASKPYDCLFGRCG